MTDWMPGEADERDCRGPRTHTSGVRTRDDVAVEPRILDLCARLLADGPADVDLDAAVLARPDFALCLCTADGWADVPLPGAVAGIGAEWLAKVRDAYLPLVPDNPSRARRGSPGKPRRSPVDGGGVAAGIVTDALVVEIASRDGDGGVWVVPYEGVAGGLADDGLSFAEPQRVGNCPGWMVQAMALEPADPARVPDPGDGFTFNPDGPFYSPRRGVCHSTWGSAG